LIYHIWRSTIQDKSYHYWLRKESFQIDRQAALKELYCKIIPQYKSKKVYTVKYAISDLPAFKQ
jgi:hypothetical protein